jgi:maltooligosyltrehalose trehalohydrolase
VDEDGLLSAQWILGNGQTLRLTANLSDSPTKNLSTSHAGRYIWGQASGDRLAPWAVIWALGEQ